MIKNGTRDKIIELLSENRRGLSILDISRLIGNNRITVAKYIYGLVSEGLVEQREVGRAKLCYLKKRDETC